MRFLHNLFVPSGRNAYRPHILRRRSLLFLLALALVAEGVLVANLIARQSGYDFLAAVIQSEIISLTNSERAQNNVKTLSENKKLNAAAQAKANDMVMRGYFAHQGPDGKEPWTWIQAAGYDYRYAGENLAVRFVDSKDVVSGWMASPTHRANMVKPVYTDIGVGIAQGMYKGQPATFVVQYFAKPAVVAAVVPPAPAAVVPARPAVAASPQPVEVLGAEAVTPAPPPASFSDSLARSLGKLASEPRATTAWILGGIIALLALALALSFFLHMQIQAHDLLVPGTVVAVVAAALLIINSNLLTGVIHDGQAASVANAILFP